MQKIKNSEVCKSWKLRDGHTPASWNVSMESVSGSRVSLVGLGLKGRSQQSEGPGEETRAGTEKSCSLGLANVEFPNR